MAENIYNEAEQNLLEEQFNKLSVDLRYYVVEKVLGSRVNVKAYYDHLKDFEKFEKTIARLEKLKNEEYKEVALRESAEKLEADLKAQGYNVDFNQALESLKSLAKTTTSETTTKSTKSKENKKFDLQIGDSKFENKGMGGQGDQSAILEAIQKVNANQTLNDKWMYVVADQRERLISLVESKSITLKDDNKNKLTVDDIRNHFKIEKLAEKAEETE
ncbi:hypothetical protein IC627_09545 [Photobacterium damselae subsp. piscicida]|uniref:Uncharacterized protein n=1 Tax=Photobacterium damsela subsp. piscicida TaxID=38294 RepID=A0A7L8A1G1_PHODP|nr:hypothetical protein [Photobacterium damselae]QOD55587.1 hypothetical protein IC627_09545 [Photobacterium damselae subsp. piscicida]